MFYGDSYFGFCQTVAETNLPCTCYGVDTWRGDTPASFYESSVYDAVSRHNDRYYRAFSYLMRTSFDDAIKQFSDSSISLLHMDGSHSYEAALHDFDLWLPKVRPGGVILCMISPFVPAITAFGACGKNYRRSSRLSNSAITTALAFCGNPAAPTKRIHTSRNCSPAPKTIRNAFAVITAYAPNVSKWSIRSGLSRASDAGHSLIQVVCARGGRYKPEERLSQIIEPGKWTSVFIRLPEGVGDRAMRLDPASRTGIIDINSILLRKVGGTNGMELDARRKRRCLPRGRNGLPHAVHRNISYFELRQFAADFFARIAQHPSD